MKSGPSQASTPTKASAREPLSLEEFTVAFWPDENTDIAYLALHYSRYVTTLNEFLSTWDTARGNRVLDIGAHWLHQSVLWAYAGFHVTALDLPVILEMDSVKATAHRVGIELIPSTDLESADAFQAIPDASVDVILIAEVIEHLTFNPIRLWKQIYRVLSPRGRLIITTPNYYAWNGRAWNFLRFVSGRGGGIRVEQILGLRTYAHHWREYSRREIIQYFQLLSPDFEIVKAKAVRIKKGGPRNAIKEWARSILEFIPALRPNLHIEVEIAGTRHGIKIEPGW